ncbi:hypothetical protein KB553_15820 [Chryseobacterium rhizoplanae]|uniref:hypothetical protein n=1 Tax=Chryseobacterium rhizoplanae TaxID=1609531 RepID=UPI001CE35402|nr:hypothetical protein [Chryseobacterium rhizoplanae]UCA58509.1 hypothetical protein KB553_15820 [Chryseobacterium rhizoplanae]
MIKYSLILLAAYFLYYAGNILYDLFLKKEKIIHVDLTEEFSLGDFAQRESKPPSTIGIEDVENVNTPKSFLKKELDFQKTSSSNEQLDLEEMRKRFESEQDIDDMPSALNDTTAAPVEESPSDNTNHSQAMHGQPVEHSKQEKAEPKKSHWKELLNLSETTVQLVANYDGQKVYHSVI